MDLAPSQYANRLARNPVKHEEQHLLFRSFASTSFFENDKYSELSNNFPMKGFNTEASSSFMLDKLWLKTISEVIYEIENLKLIVVVMNVLSLIFDNKQALIETSKILKIIMTISITIFRRLIGTVLGNLNTLAFVSIKKQ